MTLTDAIPTDATANGDSGWASTDLVIGRLLGRPPLLDVRNVVVRFGGIVANEIDRMIVREGRIVGIIGANGAGKTTLFDVISGFVEPESGSIRLDGTTEFTGLPAKTRARMGLGRSFQNATLFENMTVIETITVACQRAMSGIGFLAGAFSLPWSTAAERRTRAQVEDLVDLFGLGAFADKFVSELSTGSRRIVDLACITAHRPRLLLLDEPSSGIAQREVEALEAVLRRVKDELGCTFIVIEHDIPLIRSLADELYAMETGRVIAHGTPYEVLTDPEVIRSYLGTDESAVERSGARNGEVKEPVVLHTPARAQLERLTVAQLRQRAAELAIQGRSRMRREELIDAVIAQRVLPGEPGRG